MKKNEKKKLLIITTFLLSMLLISPSVFSITVKKTVNTKTVDSTKRNTLTKREKYAVIVAGGPFFDQLQDEFLRTAQHAYYTLRELGYDNDHIYYLSKGFFYPGVDMLSFFFSVRDAIAGWLASRSSSSSDVLIYLVDHGDSPWELLPWQVSTPQRPDSQQLA